VPRSESDPALITEAEAALADLETAVRDLQIAIARIHAALIKRYPPDSEAWFAAWEEGRLGRLWDRIERLDLQDIIDGAFG